LCQAVEDTDEEVSDTAVEALGEIGTADLFGRAVRRAVKFAERPPRGERIPGLAYAGEVGEVERIGLTYWRVGGQADKVVPALTRFLLAGGLGVREGIADIFYHMGPAAKAAVPALAQALREGDFDDSWAAADALRAIGREATAAIPILVDSLKNPHSAQWAVKVLEAIGPEAVPALVQGLRAPDAATREWAADALGQIGSPASAAVTELTALLQDRPPVRWWAAIALASIQPEAAVVPILIEALQVEAKEDVRAGAAIALGQIGANARGSLALLQEALEDGSRDVRESARRSINKITGIG
jgi:HEAT repeat protein